MSKLEKGLKNWVALGFITPDQANRIRDYEFAQPEHSWVLSGLLTFGVAIVGIGVISLIAANWNQIPDFLKLAGDFILLAAVAYATLYSWESKRALQFEALLLFFLILCLASIGLISQIYHTGGELYQAMMLWSLITFPAVLAARQTFVPYLWVGAFLTGIILTALDSAVLTPIFHKHYQAIFMTIPLLCAGFTIISKSLVEETALTRAFRSWTLTGGLVAIVVIELHKVSGGKLPYGMTPYLPGYFLAAFAAFGICMSLEYRRVQKILLLAALVVFLASFHLPLLEVEMSIAYAASTISILALMAAFLASLKERKLFQSLLSLLGLRFLVLYFQALGGLATTGIGLIVSGVLVIGMAVLWNKYRTALTVWTERWVQ